MRVSPEQVLAFRMCVQQLDGSAPTVTETEILDLGVQDTGTDGGGWALAMRGAPVTAASDLTADLVLAWTLRGAPHFYRRAEAAAVAAATAPRSEVDAAKRIFDASKPLREAGIAADEALAHVAKEMRSIVTKPTVKGDLSTALTQRLPAPYLRYCRVCEATHSYEQTFRIAALRAGLELQPGTSPPVLQRIKGWRGPARTVPDALDPIRGVLRFLGPTTHQDVAGYIDAPVSDVKAHWPADAVPVEVNGSKRWLLDEDKAALETASVDREQVLLLAPHDLFLQARDRELLAPDKVRRKQLWVVLGRPGAITGGNEIVGTWRPRASGGKLRLAVERWADVDDRLLAEQAERLAEFRGVSFAGFVG
jgi:hypothetical protein